MSQTIRCGNCGAEVEESRRFCSACGAPVTSTPAQPAGEARGRPRRPRRLVVVAAGVGIAVVAAVGAFAFIALTGSSASGGAASPDAAVSSFVEAVSNEDYVAAVAMFPPDERSDVEALFANGTSKVRTSRITSGLVLPDVAPTVEQQPAITLASDVAGVEIAGSVTVDVARLGGRIAQMLPSSRAYTLALPDPRTDGRPSLRVITLRRDGRWYVDPLLTAGEYAAARLGLPRPDYGLAGADSGEGAATPADAVSSAFSAAGSHDVNALAAVSAAAESRFLRVFGPAIHEAYARYVHRDVSISDVSVADDGDAGVRFERVAVDLQGAYDTLHLDVRSSCVDWRRSSSGGFHEFCVPTEPRLRAELGLDALHVRVEKSGGAYRAAPLRTVAALASQIAARIDPQALNGLLDTWLWTGDVKQLDSVAKPAQIGQTLRGSFDGHQFRAWDVDVPAGRHLAATAPGSGLFAYKREAGGSWSYADDAAPIEFTAKVDSTLRLVAYDPVPSECEHQSSLSPVFVLTGCWWTPPSARYEVAIS